MNRSSGKLQAELMAVQAAPIVCFEERTPAFIGSQRFCRKNFTAEPMEWRTDYGAEAQVQPYGVLFCLGRRTEGVQGGTEGNISPVGCPPKAEMTRSSGKQQAERTAVRAAPIVCPEESPLVRPQAQSPFSDEELTRRLRRGWWGCRPEGGKYFLSKRKKVPKKARGTATPGKRLLLPILTAGLATSRAP